MFYYFKSDSESNKNILGLGFQVKPKFLKCINFLWASLVMSGLCWIHRESHIFPSLLLKLKPDTTHVLLFFFRINCSKTTCTIEIM